RRRHTISKRDWSSDVCSSDLDCGVEITDYQLEKIQYDSARMLLCCDVSGSMAGQPIEDLKAAVGEMANSASGDISLAVVTFNSKIGRASCRGSVLISVGGRG